MTHRSAAPTVQESDGQAINGPDWRTTWRLDHAGGEWWWALSSSVLLWAAFPPLNLWPLAWIAPVGWLYLVVRPNWSTRRPYRLLYVAGLLHWLLLVHWIRLPHWSAHFGWIALSAYLAAYLPVFVSVARWLVHRAGWPLVVAAPVVWTALEWVRGRLFTGFSISLLGHTQQDAVPLIQIANLCGAYGVSFVVLTVAAGVARTWWSRKYAWRSLAWAALLSIASWCYGWGQFMTVEPVPTKRSPLRVALIQGSLDTVFGSSAERIYQSFLDYLALSRQAVAQQPDLDLIIWPESMFTANQSMVSYERPLQRLPEWEQEGSLESIQTYLERYAAGVRERFAWVARQVQTPMLVGMEWEHYRQGRAERSNTALLIDEQGEVRDRYNKMHPVMFGEYVPLGKHLPWLYRLTPMSRGLEPGREPRSFSVGEYQLSPSICFENTVPHLIRRQLRELSARGQQPDALVTISNDGWFWGSSLLDLHLTCGIFRAIENGRPMLIASNTGISAWVDRRGRVRARGPRRQTAILTAVVEGPPVKTVYLRYGDWLPYLCVLTIALSFGRHRWRGQPATNDGKYK